MKSRIDLLEENNIMSDKIAKLNVDLFCLKDRIVVLLDINVNIKKKLDEAVKNGIFGYIEKEDFTPECYYFKNNESEAINKLNKIYKINKKYNLLAIKKYEFKKTLKKIFEGGEKLKIGDIVEHKNSFDIVMKHKIIGFNKNDIFIDWDCFWIPIKENDIIKIIKKG